MAAKKIAVVTGANKGVGYGIVRQLLLQTQTPLLIYLTSRDKSRGQDALSRIHASQDLKSALETSRVEWHALDILDQTSIDSLAAFIAEKHGRLDILINNAGIATKGDTFNRDVVSTTLASNYDATRAMCRAFIPLVAAASQGHEGHAIAGRGRIVNVSSMAGKLGKLSADLQSRFRDPQQTVAGIDALMREFEQGVQDSTPPQGWPRAGYAVSKMGVTGMTKALARSNEAKNILINAVCPGYVNTDMTSGKGIKSIDEGAMTPTFAAIGDIGNTTGEFFEDCRVSQW